MASISRAKQTSVLAACGLISSLLSISFAYYPTWFPGSSFAPGFFFGAVISMFLLTRKNRSGQRWKPAVLPIISILAYYCAVGTTVKVESALSPITVKLGETSGLALFVGGTAGAMIILTSFKVLVPPPEFHIGVLGSILLCSLVGGLLGVIGWKLGPSLGLILWSGARSVGLTAPNDDPRSSVADPGHFFSLWVVWQTGLGAILGTLMHNLDARIENKTPV